MSRRADMPPARGAAATVRAFRARALLVLAAIVLIALVAFALLAFAVVIPASAQTSPRVVTLSEALTLSRQNAAALIQAQGQKRLDDVAVRTAWGSFLPSLSLSAGSTRQLPSGSRTRIENGQIVLLPAEPWSYSMGYSASLQIFDGGQRFFDLRQAKARSIASSANLVVQRYATALDVKQSYYEVLAARESGGAAAAQLEQAQAQARYSFARTRARTATRSDSLRAEIQVRTAQIAVEQSRNDLEVAEAALARAIGSNEPVTAEPDTAEMTPLALDDAELRRLAESGPTVQEASASLEASHAARQGTWADYLPGLSASYQRGGSGNGTPFFDPNDMDYNGSLRFSASLPVFDQFQRSARGTQAKVAEDNAHAQLRDARLAAVENVTRALGTFHTAAQRVESQIATVDAASEDLRVQQQRYNAGGSTLLDVLASQTQLNNARLELIRARYDQRIAKAQLEALVGREL